MLSMCGAVVAAWRGVSSLHLSAMFEGLVGFVASPVQVAGIRRSH